MEQALDMPFSLLNPPGAYSPLSAAYSNATSTESTGSYAGG